MSERQQRQRRARQQAVVQFQRQAAHVEQPSLLLAASRAEERFQAFHRQHPEIYREFARRALALYQRGHRHWGAKCIFEVLRYESAISGKPDDTWKINNSHISRYSRLLTDEHPELRGFFEQRVLRSA